MPIPSLTITDFTGSLLVNWQTARFSQYITEKYTEIIRDCIGDTATIEAGLSVQDKWDDLFSGGIYTDKEGKKKMNDGLTKAVKFFLFSEFVNDNFVPTNNAGLKRPLSENSDRLSAKEIARIVQDRYNSGVLTMRNIACFVDAYKDYEQSITGFADNGGGSYTILAGTTKYLYDDDEVKIAGVEYVVSNVVADTSFDITSTDATSFEGVYITNPYDDVILGNLIAMI